MNKPIHQKFLIINLVLSIFFALPAFSEANTKETFAVTQEENGKFDTNTVSEAFGHLIGKNLESLGFEFNMNRVIQGIQDAVAGKTSPMNESECIQAIYLVQEAEFKKTAEKNLTSATAFLTQNSQNSEIIELEKDKLQIKIEKKGEGSKVEEHFTPLIRYTGKFLDGTVFLSSKEDEIVALDEFIPGFTKGVVGMHEGEKRTIFIHPDLGYGMSPYLPPNSLLVFDVEVIKANESRGQEEMARGAEMIQSDEEIASTDLN